MIPTDVQLRYTGKRKGHPCTGTEVKDVGQVEIHTVEPLVPEPSAFEVELAIQKLKNHKPQGIDQIPAELIKAGGRTIRCEIH